MNFIARQYQDIFEFISLHRLENNTNTKAYKKYLKFCEERGFKPIDSKITFSRYITKFSDYKIVNKTIKNKKYRIFVKKNK